MWVDTISKHIVTSTILLRYEFSCMVYRPEWYQNINTVKYVYPTIIKKSRTSVGLASLFLIRSGFLE